MPEHADIGIFSEDINIDLAVRGALKPHGFSFESLDLHYALNNFHKLRDFMDQTQPSIIVMEIPPPFTPSLAFLREDLLDNYPFIRTILLTSDRTNVAQRIPDLLNVEVVRLPIEPAQITEAVFTFNVPLPQLQPTYAWV